MFVSDKNNIINLDKLLTVNKCKINEPFGDISYILDLEYETKSLKFRYSNEEERNEMFNKIENILTGNQIVKFNSEYKE